MFTRRSFETLVLILFLCGAAFGQSANDRIQRMALPKSDTGSYRLGQGDVVRISVFGVEAMTQSLRLGSEGSAEIPFVGEVNLGGLTTAEAAERIESRLVEMELVLNPQVGVFVEQYLSRPAYVLGMVATPGEYYLDREMNLIDLLAKAGGLQEEDAQMVAIVQQRDPENGDTTVTRRVDLQKLLYEGHSELNLNIWGGDVITIPRREIQQFYVIGEVAKAGAYQLPHDTPLLVTQAVATAGGPLKTAKTSGGLLLRYDEDGNRQQFSVDLNRIVKGAEPDFLVRGNDVLFFPGSKIKTLGWGLVAAVPSLLSDLIIFGSVR
ncbi:MAG: polysaccharide biosynthesis/export family protein [Acidobacteriota bacterium]|nr:MAG: polysaccharide biosynthesis/export family protein [Acidobacteriota bacterium]